MTQVLFDMVMESYF